MTIDDIYDVNPFTNLTMIHDVKGCTEIMVPGSTIAKDRLLLNYSNGGTGNVPVPFRKFIFFYMYIWAVVTQRCSA